MRIRLLGGRDSLDAPLKREGVQSGVKEFLEKLGIPKKSEKIERNIVPFFYLIF